MRDINRVLVENKYQFQINKNVISIDGGKEAERIHIVKIRKVVFSCYSISFYHGATVPSVPQPPHYRGNPQPDKTYSVGLLWMSDQPDAQNPV